ncbi:MAG: hypothetical protein DRP45_02890 [Candidatus Zixiibacteriota bacterium]|nr:MAG: hypothetical protein DRP45_02890 [candidate division Zixibacteria bacterium]
MMPSKADSTGSGAGGRRQRSRLRGMLSSKTGKTIGFTSIAAPIIGYVVNDLKKPDSLVRSLLSGAVRKLLPAKTEIVEAVDITDEVEIIENHKEKKA